MANISSKKDVEIAAPREEVFACIRLLKNHYLWSPNLRSLSFEGEMQEGLTYEATSTQLRDMKITAHNKIVKLDEPNTIQIENHFGQVEYDVLINFTDKNGGTLVSSEIHITTKSQLFGLTLPILKSLANNELQHDLELMKFVIENKVNIATKALA